MRQRFWFYIIFFPYLLIASSCKDDFGEHLKPSYKKSQLEDLAFQKMNQYRESLELPPLIFSQVIFEETREHSLDMAEGQNSFNHEGFNERLANIREEISFGIAGENIGYNSDAEPVEKMLEKWLDSERHRKHIENKAYSHSGIGIAKNENGIFYFTQIFIEKK